MDHRGGPGWITEGVLDGSQRESWGITEGVLVDHRGSPGWIKEGVLDGSQRES